MNLFEEAQAFMAKHSATPAQKNDFLMTTKSREDFIRELKLLYENATNMEIERALDWVMAQLNTPYHRDQVLKMIRVKLED